MRKIIHLSDLHIGWKKKVLRKLDTIVVTICLDKVPGSSYVVVATGDLVDDAHQGKYGVVRGRLDALVQAGAEVLVVPGNHDYGTGAFGNKKFVKLFKEAFFDDPGVTYPKVDLVRDPASPDEAAETIAFIGLDSMAEELGFVDRLFAEGELGKDQLRRLDEALKTQEVRACGKRVVYLHHHPFDPKPFHYLKDGSKLRRVLEAHIANGTSIDALLYGHNHRGKRHHGVWGIPRCYDGSSSTGRRKKKSNPTLQRVIDLNRDPRWDYNGDFHR